MKYQRGAVIEDWTTEVRQYLHQDSIKDCEREAVEVVAVSFLNWPKSSNPGHQTSTNTTYIEVYLNGVVAMSK